MSDVFKGVFNRCLLFCHCCCYDCIKQRMWVSHWSPWKTRAMKPPPKPQRSPNYSKDDSLLPVLNGLRWPFVKAYLGDTDTLGIASGPLSYISKPQITEFWGRDDLMLGPSVQLRAQGQASPEEDLALPSGSKRWPNFLYCPSPKASVPYEKFYRHWLGLLHMAFVPMGEENGRVSSDMSSISRRTNSSCSNRSSNAIPSIIHRARHFLPHGVILILQLGQLKLGVDAQSHTGNTQHSQESSSGLARFQHL